MNRVACLPTDAELYAVHTFLNQHLARPVRACRRVGGHSAPRKERAAILLWLNQVMRPTKHLTPAAAEVQRIRERRGT